MKRLFTVADKHFGKKAEAKAFRDAHGGVAAGLFVKRGPDHCGPHGNHTRKQEYKNATR